MKYLLDTHVLVWLLYEPERLTERVRDALTQPASILVVSHASVWELLNKVGRGRLSLLGNSVRGVLDRILDLGVTLLPITLDDISAAATLPHHHNDPFDRLLISQAFARDLTLVSVDSKFAAYGVSLLWS